MKRNGNEPLSHEWMERARATKEAAEDTKKATRRSVRKRGGE